MTSHQPRQCCTIGVKHEGQASGEIQTLGGYASYVSYPKDKKTDNAVLILPDVIGHEFINAQLIADQFAANGYFTVIPDMFNGDTVKLNPPEGFDFMQWMKGHPTSEGDKVTETLIGELKNKFGVKKLGLVGFCWGAKYAVRYLKKGTADAAFVAHPSFVEADELKAIEGPLSIAAAESDDIFPEPKRHESEEILKKGRKTYQINLFSATSHGFAVRGDIKDPQVKWAKEQAFYQAVAWFDEYLKA